MRQNGKSFREIGERFSVSPSTARRWVQGGEHPKPPPPPTPESMTTVYEDGPDWVSAAIFCGAIVVIVIVAIVAWSHGWRP